MKHNPSHLHSVLADHSPNSSLHSDYLLHVLVRHRMIRDMVCLLATMGIGSLLVSSTLGSPLNHVVTTSRPDRAERSTTAARNSFNSILADLKLNYSITVPIPSGHSNDFWHIECDHEAVPPGWAAPPEFYDVGAFSDCNKAIMQVTRGSDPREPQVWTAQASWTRRSCGVFLVPGQVLTRVNFARIDIGDIAKEVAKKCIYERTTPPQGGWAAIGGYFIVLLTGTGESRKP